MIKILNTNDQNFEFEFQILLERANMDMHSLIPSVLQTLIELKKDKNKLLDIVRKYDNWNPVSLNDLKIDFNEAEDSFRNLNVKLKDSLKIAHDRIYEFHLLSKNKGFIHEDSLNNILGQRVLPVHRAGIYIPGGKAFYPSSLLMNAIPAIVAGVKEIVVTSPTPNNHIDNLVLATLFLCNIKEGYKIGGVGAIGLLAYGNDEIKKVDVITGPGNIYVATAKKLVFGDVNIDMIAGPSEICIISNKIEYADVIAIDLLSQAEHDESASSIFITPNANLAKNVQKSIEKQLQNLKRKDIASVSIEKHGTIIVCQDLNEAFELSNKIAPEHLEIILDDAFNFLPMIKNAGAVFLGRFTPEAIGDYLAGPNHTLPTGGSARFFSPLSVENFCKRSSIISFSENGFKSLSVHCANLANSEGLEAHGLSILSRLNK